MDSGRFTREIVLKVLQFYNSTNVGSGDFYWNKMNLMDNFMDLSLFSISTMSRKERFRDFSAQKRDFVSPFIMLGLRVRDALVV